MSIVVSRAASIPDETRLERYRRAPELGPSVLFFSGGSALKPLCKVLAGYTKNSIHLLTPFDSGGSSAELRKAFGMPAVGDLRSRLLALAKRGQEGNQAVYQLVNYRLPENESPAELRTMISDIAKGKHPLIEGIPEPLKKLIQSQINHFLEAMPVDFNLRGASVGNLVLTGGYLSDNRDLEPILFVFSRLLGVQGVVRPISDAPYHLAVGLENDEHIIGQDRFTGKMGSPIVSPIKSMWLTREYAQNTPVEIQANQQSLQHIRQADLICFPPGSFYSSVIANLLPRGVGRAISENPNPKVYVPNLGTDPEQLGMSLLDSVKTLIKFIDQDCDGEQAGENNPIDYVLIDEDNSHYPGEFESGDFDKLGITLVRTPLISEGSNPYYDTQLLTRALLSLV